jgi:hypothetical protein
LYRYEHAAKAEDTDEKPWKEVDSKEATGMDAAMSGFAGLAAG